MRNPQHHPDTETEKARARSRYQTRITIRIHKTQKAQHTKCVPDPAHVVGCRAQWPRSYGIGYETVGFGRGRGLSQSGNGRHESLALFDCPDG